MCHFNTDNIVLQDECIINFFEQFENKIFNDIKKWEKMGINNNAKFMSFVNNLDGMKVVKLNFNKIKPVLYDSKNK